MMSKIGRVGKTLEWRGFHELQTRCDICHVISVTKLLHFLRSFLMSGDRIHIR